MTRSRLRQAKIDRTPIAMLTAYEAGFARVAAAAGVANSDRLVDAQVAVDRARQPFETGTVELVLAPKRVHDLGGRLPLDRVPHVVGQLDVADDAAVLVFPLNRA